ncbi:AAA family ATPase [Rhodovulum sulfidophilum]|uniref:AAA family ATPase n=1 Tax=Rhodovulum sulfidophilum TaxID=35806 RepID=UPI003075D477
MPSHVAAAAKAARYNARVFLAPYWDEIFTQDTERTQTRAEAEATGAVMRDTYTALGYEIIELPRTDIARRADFVCEQLAI